MYLDTTKRDSRGHILSRNEHSFGLRLEHITMKECKLSANTLRCLPQSGLDPQW